ncbi:MAG: VOC family protein [Mycobacteriaceae bacterium]|nr:VOC family protein [Mycobacteriaceae bacterium]
MTMSLRFAFHCADHAVLAAFWAEILQCSADLDNSDRAFEVGVARVPHPPLLFRSTANPARRGIALELTTQNWLAAMDQAVWQGARLIDEHRTGIRSARLADPAGNDFVLIEDRRARVTPHRHPLPCRTRRP